MRGCSSRILRPSALLKCAYCCDGRQHEGGAIIHTPLRPRMKSSCPPRPGRTERGHRKTREPHYAFGNATCAFFGKPPPQGRRLTPTDRLKARSGPRPVGSRSDQIVCFWSVSLCPSALTTLFVWRSSSCTRVLAGALWVRRSAPTRDLGRLVAHGLRSAHDALIDITELSRPSSALGSISREPAGLRENRAGSWCCCSAGRGISVCPRGDRTSRPRRSSMQQRVLPKLPTRRGEPPCVEEHEASSLPPHGTHTIAGAQPRVCRSGS